MVNVNLNHAEAARLVDRLSTLIQEDDENTTALPLAYTPQGVGIRRRIVQGASTSNSSWTIDQPHNEHPHRPALPTPTGFEHNQGAAFIPFKITNSQGREVTARYIQVHMNTDNPYVLVCATLTSPIYGGQLHATLVNDTDQPVKPLTDIAMRMFTADFPGRCSGMTPRYVVLRLKEWRM